MTSEELTCRIRVQKSQSTDEGTTPSEELTVLDLKDCPDIPTKTREKWADNLITIIAESEVADTLRPWDLLLGLDGTVSTLPVPAPKRIVALEYPARYRIPPNSLYGYDEKESMRRAESFALGSLLYEIETGRMPFESLSDSEVQRKYSAGDFPRDVSRLKLGSAIYSSWSWEFLEGSKKLAEIRASQPAYKRYFGKIAKYAKENPHIVGGGALSLGILAVPGALPAVGFAKTGIVAGSIAAAWQATMPLIPAGSLISWFQSAGMGGPALVGLWTAAGSGAGAVAGITATSAFFSPSEMENIFRRTYRKGCVKPML